MSKDPGSGQHRAQKQGSGQHRAQGEERLSHRDRSLERCMRKQYRDSPLRRSTNSIALRTRLIETGARFALLEEGEQTGTCAYTEKDA